jgi:hypothetical protein
MSYNVLILFVISLGFGRLINTRMQSIQSSPQTVVSVICVAGTFHADSSNEHTSFINCGTHITVANHIETTKIMSLFFTCVLLYYFGLMGICPYP